MNKIQFTYIYNLKWNLGTVPEKRLSQPRVEIVVVVRGSGSRTIFTENLENHCLLENVNDLDADDDFKLESSES